MACSFQKIYVCDILLRLTIASKNFSRAVSKQERETESVAPFPSKQITEIEIYNSNSRA